MATDIEKLPVAQSLPEGTNIAQATDVISGILNRSAETPPKEDAPLEAAPKQSLETPDKVPNGEEAEAQEEPSMEAKEETVPEKAPESIAATPEGDAEEIELEPSQLAAILGLEENDLVIDDEGSLSFRAKVDGELQAVNLNDLRDSYQIRRTAEQRLSKLGEERKVFETDRTEAFQKLQQQSEAMAQAMGVIEQEYAADFQGVDWNSLRQEDPTGYNLKRADFDDRRRRIEEHKAKHQQMYAEAAGDWQKQQNQLIAEGQEKLEEVFSGQEYAKAPAWDDASKKDVFEFMVKEGVPLSLLQNSPLWQAFRWARDSMLYRQMRTDAQKTLKKVVKLPKVTKPGSQKSKSEARKTTRMEGKARQKKAGGTVQATAERISSILRGS